MLGRTCTQCASIVRMLVLSKACFSKSEQDIIARIICSSNAYCCFSLVTADDNPIVHLRRNWKIGRAVQVKVQAADDQDPCTVKLLSCTILNSMSTVALSDEEDRGRVLSTVGESTHTSLSIGDKEYDTLIVHPILRPAPVIQLKRKLLILDLNGLLVDIVSPPPKDLKSDINIARRAIFRRPYYLDFLKFCLERFEVGIWSSRAKKNIVRIVDYLMGDMKLKLLFCWDSSHCTKSSFRTLENMHKTMVFKDLRRLWEKHDPELPWEKGYFNESNTLLIDDSPYKALLNPDHTAIFPYPFQFQHTSDDALGERGEIRLYLQGLAEADSIPHFVAANPFGQAAISDKSATWEFYHQVIMSVCPTQQV